MKKRKKTLSINFHTVCKTSLWEHFGFFRHENLYARSFLKKSFPSIVRVYVVLTSHKTIRRVPHADYS